MHLFVDAVNSPRDTHIIHLIAKLQTKQCVAHTQLTSIANCPAYVPVIVLDCPAARIPTPQMYMAAAPNAQPKKTPPLKISATTSSLLSTVWKKKYIKHIYHLILYNPNLCCNVFCVVPFMFLLCNVQLPLACN